MEYILADVSDEALVTAIRTNMCDFFRLVSRSDPAERLETARFTRWYSAVPHPWFTGVLSSDYPREGDETFVAEVIEHFRQKGVGTFTWWLEPPLIPSDWKSVLSRHGFGFSDDTPGMAVNLQELNESMPKIDELEIRVVADEEALRIWTKVFVYGNGMPPAWASMLYEMFMKLGLDLPVRNYLGYLNGKPMSISTLFIGGGAAGIYSVATLPEARGKGLGAALTLQPLLEAREMGYRVGVLQSSDMGFNIYKKLGFRHLCQIENFYLSIR